MENLRHAKKIPDKLEISLVQNEMNGYTLSYTIAHAIFYCVTYVSLFVKDKSQFDKRQKRRKIVLWNAG